MASELTFYNRKRETHLTPAFLCAMGGVIGTPFSTAFSMLKAARTETTATRCAHGMTSSTHTLTTRFADADV